MKKFLKSLLLVLVVVFTFTAVGCNNQEKDPEEPDVPPIVDPDPDKPVDPDPDKPVDPDPEVPTDNWPYEVGKAYKFTLVQENAKKTVYFTGEMHVDSKGNAFYMETSENAAEGVDVYCEKLKADINYILQKVKKRTILVLLKVINLQMQNLVQNTQMYLLGMKH